MYYLVEHNRTTKETKLTEYVDYDIARVESLHKEQDYFKQRKNEMEVVVFESDSLESLKKTHSRYFVHEYMKERKKDNVALGVAGAVTAIGLVGLAVYLLRKE